MYRKRYGLDDIDALAYETFSPGETETESPMHAAVRNDDVIKLRWILAGSGLDPDATNFYGWTALHVACQEGRAECAAALLAAGADATRVAGGEEGRRGDCAAARTALGLALFAGRMGVVKMLLEDPRVRERLLSLRMPGKRSLMTLVAGRGNVDVIRLVTLIKLIASTDAYQSCSSLLI